MPAPQPISKIQFLPKFLDDFDCQRLTKLFNENCPKHLSTHIPPGSTTPTVDSNVKKRFDLYLSEEDGKQFNQRWINWMAWKPWKSKRIKTEGMRIGQYLSDGFFKPHRDNDGPLVSSRLFGFVAAINYPWEYNGGNLVFPELGVTTRLNRGDAIVFDADILHGVSPVTSGSRLVLISFAYT